jgi:hypothetical protein
MPMQVNMEGRGERMNSVRNKHGTGHRHLVWRGKKRTRRVLSISLWSVLIVTSGYFDVDGRNTSDVSDASMSMSDCSSWASSSPVIFLFELFGLTSEVHRMLDMSLLFLRC